MTPPWRSSWWWLCGLHAALSLLVWWAPSVVAEAFTWRAHDGWVRPWTLWTSAWVHLNLAHLVGNVLAMGGVAAAGWVLKPDGRCTLAWLMAWPLTQVSLLWWPQVGYAVGLSGLMHAGVLLLAVQVALVRLPIRGARFWGWLLVAVVMSKVILERGWSQPIVWNAEGNLPVVQAAHVTGAFWGVLLGLVVPLVLKRPQKSPP
ncbi:rhomboid family intramembrane serine protease [Hydrogenophaga laconesensis]|uniref:Membrane associated rhomboid family serine protease n=1 Tax=Hydrogenophaga laconesensis TaxID=1805971 RepID=A0ABU1VD17_9BURK|nr:rhomboid family intramembrane serine protease [Hydrogenophaga laconesensis]MDR7095250.1 membrane associated rhomboid family serine protease [Hydrogenophaga laconesensis]